MTLLIANKDGLYADRRVIDEMGIVTSRSKIIPLHQSLGNPDQVGAIAFCGNMPATTNKTISYGGVALCNLINAVHLFQSVEELEPFHDVFYGAIGVITHKLCLALAVEKTAAAVIVSKHHTFFLRDVGEVDTVQNALDCSKIRKRETTYIHNPSEEIVYGSAEVCARIFLDHDLTVLDVYRKSGIIDNMIDGNNVDHVSRSTLSDEVDFKQITITLGIFLPGIEPSRKLITGCDISPAITTTYRKAMVALDIATAMCKLGKPTVKTKKGIKAIKAAIIAQQRNISQEDIDNVVLNDVK